MLVSDGKTRRGVQHSSDGAEEEGDMVRKNQQLEMKPHSTCRMLSGEKSIFIRSHNTSV